MNQIRVELQESMGNDRSIGEAAWTSSLDYQKKQIKTEEDVAKVVKMLADSGHSTPFESVIFKFWIKMPIQTDRQHMTHRIGSHNGMSGRYRTMPDEWLAVPDDVSDITDKVNPDITYKYLTLCNEANHWYKQALAEAKDSEKNKDITNAEYKRLREFYRGVLPQNNMTERVTIMNLRSFSNYMKLRLSNDAQPEIREVARLMLEAVKNANVAPIALSALENNNWNI